MAGNIQFTGALMPAGLSGSSGQILISGGSGVAPTWTGLSSVACTSSGGIFCQGGNSFGATATLGTNDSNALNFETGNATRMSIAATGNVGIGTTSPSSTLHVNGTTTTTGLKITGLAGTSNFNPYHDHNTDGTVRSDPNAMRTIGGWSAMTGPRKIVSFCSFADAGSDPMPLPASANGVYSYDGCWTGMFYTPAVAAAGTVFYVQVNSTYSDTINASRTDLAGDITVSHNNTAIFRSDGSKWVYQGVVPTADLNDNPLAITAGNIGIGTASPKAKFDLQGVFYGNGDLRLHAFEGDGSNGTAYVQARDFSGSSNIGLSLRSQNAGAQVNALYIQPDGDVGIGTTSPNGKLTVNGTAAKPGGGSWGTFSDRRLKKNIRDFGLGLDAIKALKPVTFQYNGIKFKDDGQTYTGLIAQDVAGTPLDHFTLSKSSDGYYQFDDTAITYALVNAVKEQQMQIDRLKQAVWNGGLVTNDTTFKGLVRFAGEVRLSGKNAGTATIRAGHRSVDVVLPKSLGGIPDVTIGKADFTPLNDYRVTAKTRNGFRIELLLPTPRDVRFDWHAFVAE